MRSRYTAFTRGDGEHLFRTWHPRTRPDDSSVSPLIQWQRLEIIDCRAGLPDDAAGEVEFRAHFEGVDGPGVLHERSLFARRAGRWLYVEPVDVRAG